ncbi:unnamed protein product [Nezara viridula]|uniref:Uncharacterized protein n=1 Tax=Nezara viridula TaxID=85310 RepID=A0A9P0H1I5_NEZVI|nr:unnamed protein product [Nezara viridula]
MLRRAEISAAGHTHIQDRSKGLTGARFQYTRQILKGDRRSRTGSKQRRMMTDPVAQDPERCPNYRAEEDIGQVGNARRPHRGSDRCAVRHWKMLRMLCTKIASWQSQFDYQLVLSTIVVITSEIDSAETGLRQI